MLPPIRELQPIRGAHAFPYDRKSRAGEQHAVPQGRRNMGLPSLSEFEIFRTDAEKIREARKVLEEL